VDVFIRTALALLAIVALASLAGCIGTEAPAASPQDPRTSSQNASLPAGNDSGLMLNWTYPEYLGNLTAAIVVEADGGPVTCEFDGSLAGRFPGPISGGDPAVGALVSSLWTGSSAVAAVLDGAAQAHLNGFSTREFVQAAANWGGSFGRTIEVRDQAGVLIVGKKSTTGLDIRRTVP